MHIISYLIRLRQNIIIFIDRSCSQLHSNVRFMGRSVEFVNSIDYLGVPLCTDLNANHIHSDVPKFFV